MIIAETLAGGLYKIIYDYLILSYCAITERNDSYPEGAGFSINGLDCSDRLAMHKPLQQICARWNNENTIMCSDV